MTVHIESNKSGPAADQDGERDRTGRIVLSVLVPVLNEEGAPAPFVAAVEEIMQPFTDVDVEFVFVNDGSRDGTLRELLELRRRNQKVKVIDLSRNFGKEAALTAALDHCTGDAVVPMDVDLQDPPELLPKMIELWRFGHDVVLAKRSSRQSDSMLKRLTATAFYRWHNAVSEPEISENVGDFRLLDSSVVAALRRLPESRRFMKGLFAWVGFRSAVVEYERPPRSVGSSKFNGWHLWNLALEGVTSFSTAPLRVWTYVGGTVALASFAYGAYLAFRTIFRGIDVPGYASIFVAVVFLGGLQLVGIGVIGEYLGRTYIESKNRPVYVVRRVYGRVANSQIKD